MSDPATPHPRDADRLIYAGLLGLAATATVQLLEKDELDVSQLVAIYAFAAAIPFLTVGLVTDYARRSGTEVPHWRDDIGKVAVLLAVVGLGAVFFHFGVGPGVVFAVGTIMSAGLVRRL